jgi:predicted phosphoribosyltransferase
MSAMIFKDRTEAGKLLAAALAPYRGKAVVVYALPRGGVPVAAEIARALNAPLDLLLVRKIGAPLQPELAVGAVIDGKDPVYIRNEDIIALTGTTEAEFQRRGAAELAEIERRRALYLQGRTAPDPSHKVAIVVDDGIATGATTRAALRALRQRGPAELVLAVPVAPADTLAELRPEVDQLVCLHTPDVFYAIGPFYRDFHQMTDQEVVAALAGVPDAAAIKRSGLKVTARG